MDAAHDLVRKILTEKKQQLEVIAQTLLEKETILGDELKDLIEKGSASA